MTSSGTVSTLFLLIGGADPLTRDDLERVVAPVLTQTFKAYDHSTTSVIAPTWKYRSETDPLVQGGADVGYYINAGALADPIATYPAPYAYVTGLLWHLYNRDVPADLRGALSQLRGAPSQTLVDSGYTVMRSGLYPYGDVIRSQAMSRTLGTPSGYLEWPTMPPLPTIHKDVPVEKSGPSPWWLLLLGIPLAKNLSERRR